MNKENSKQTNNGINIVGLGLIFGAAIGFMLGGPIGIGIGAGIGIVIGAAIGVNQRKVQK